jgi:hypothetical protein
VFSLIIIWPADKVLDGFAQPQIDSIISKVIAKLREDQNITLNLEEYKRRYIYDCVSRDLCSTEPKSTERIKTVRNMDYVIEKDGRRIDPPEKMRFNMSALDGKVLIRYDFVEIDSSDPNVIVYDFHPKTDRPKATSETERATDMTTGRMIISRNDFGIISISSGLSHPISFGNLFLIKVFQLFNFDITVDRKKFHNKYYTTTRAVTYVKFQRVFAYKKYEKHEIVLTDPSQ